MKNLKQIWVLTVNVKKPNTLIKKSDCWNGWNTIHLYAGNSNQHNLNIKYREILGKKNAKIYTIKTQINGKWKLLFNSWQNGLLNTFNSRHIIDYVVNPPRRCNVASK